MSRCTATKATRSEWRRRAMVCRVGSWRIVTSSVASAQQQWPQRKMIAVSPTFGPAQLLQRGCSPVMAPFQRESNFNLGSLAQRPTAIRPIAVHSRSRFTSTTRGDLGEGFEAELGNPFRGCLRCALCRRSRRLLDDRNAVPSLKASSCARRAAKR